MKLDLIYPLMSMGVILLILIVRNRGYRHLNPERLWIAPAIIIGLATFAAATVSAQRLEMWIRARSVRLRRLAAEGPAL